MKRKATTRRIVVKNGGFMAVVNASFAERAEIQKRVMKNAQDSGTISVLVAANKKSSSTCTAAVKK